MQKISVEIGSRFKEVQNAITSFVEQADGNACKEENWEYQKEKGAGTGGGCTRVWEGGDLLEKGGVNYSFIEGGKLPQSAATAFSIDEGTPFLATGVSLVLHPWNPHVPTIHMNIRYFEAGDLWWFGGGIDLTPIYPQKEQVIAFHKELEFLCQEHGEEYTKHKEKCDRYFFLPHRGETRGVGGLFFDHLNTDKHSHLEFTAGLGMQFNNLYTPFVKENRGKVYTEEEREFQLFRRSRYVEFNLLYDRGTHFGLQSGGRTESILMSMPATAKWRYNWCAEPGTREAELTEFYLQPQNWVDM
jgi:coproporphyrinogen III oxidase